MMNRLHKKNYMFKFFFVFSAISYVICQGESLIFLKNSFPSDSSRPNYALIAIWANSLAFFSRMNGLDSYPVPSRINV